MQPNSNLNFQQSDLEYPGGNIEDILYSIRDKKLIKKDEIGRILLWVSSGDRWELWDELVQSHKMSPFAFGYGLNIAYTTGKYWDKYECLDMFYCTDRRYVMSKDEQLAFEKLPEIIEIYRGGFLNEKKYSDFGLSWTTDIKVAELFNDLHKQYGYKDTAIFKTTINKKDVIAYFLHREEFEIIADIENAEIYKI